MPRTTKKEVRIDAVVETEEDRQKISAAAEIAQQSARVFVGQAALRAASPESMQIARLEHITQVQEGLTLQLETLKRQLQELGGTLTKVCNTSAKSVSQHAETHEQLGEAMKRQACLERQLNESLVGHAETHERLMAILEPIENISHAVSEGVEKIRELHDCIISPDDMKTVLRACRYLAVVTEHLGIKLEGEEESDSA